MKKIAIIIACAGLIGWAARSGAEEAAPGAAPAVLQEAAPAPEADPVQEETIAAPAQPVPRTMRISERFGRGIANIFSSPFELPAQIYVRATYQQDKSDSPFAVIGGLVEGVPMGALVYFPWRLYAGVVDIVTLWAPECDEALIYPEYISFSSDFLEDTNLPVDKTPQAGAQK